MQSRIEGKLDDELKSLGSHIVRRIEVRATFHERRVQPDLGAMLGGFLEYNSMYWGLSSLYPLGIGLYALALVCTFVEQRQTQKSGTEHENVEENPPMRQAG